jgi:hypothetical protein
VIGVMPPRFAFPEFAALWLPIAGEASVSGSSDRGIGTVGRLKAGVTRAQATAEMETISAGLSAQDSATYHGWIARVGPLKQNISNDNSGQAFLLALGASGLRAADRVREPGQPLSLPRHSPKP